MKSNSEKDNVMYKQNNDVQMNNSGRPRPSTLTIRQGKLQNPRERRETLRIIKMMRDPLPWTDRLNGAVKACQSPFCCRKMLKYSS